jgi:hypothetical protein
MPSSMCLNFSSLLCHQHWWYGECLILTSKFINISDFFVYILVYLVFDSPGNFVNQV